MTSMIGSPISTIPFYRAWSVWFLVPIFAVAPAMWTDLVADDDAPPPTWRQGISQWTGSQYELPGKLSAPKLTETPSNPLPYTIPIDPTQKAGPRANVFVPETGDQKSQKFSTPADLPGPDEVTKFASQQEFAPLRNPGNVRKPSRAEIQPLPPPESVELAEEAAEFESSDLSFAEMMATIQNGETAPLQDEVVRWYEYPRRWIRGWDSHAEIGLNGSDGNADTLAIQTGFELKRKSDAHVLAIDVDYRLASSRNKTIEENGRFNIDYDRFLKNPACSAFGKFGLEWDRFKAFDLRLNLNGGIGYHWIRQDDRSLVLRFGAGGSREIGAPDDDWIPEGVCGIDAERQITERQKLRARVDYFPAWSNFGDYRLVSDLAWEVLLDGTNNLSLKLAASDRYDSTPQGAKPNDIYYSVLVLRKF
jgi:putative salt-induced outer membrane protein YdiY